MIKDNLCSVSECYQYACAQFKGKPYCNKHWLRLYTHGSTEVVGKRKKTKYEKLGNYAIGITSSGDRFKFDLDDWSKVTKHSWISTKAGYFVCTYKQQNMRLHRLIMNCEDSQQVVDHINGDPSDNRKQNLRVTTQKNNSRNIKTQSNNTTGVTGVGLLPNGKYRARIMVYGKEIRIGTFKTKQEATLARKKAEIKYFGEFVRDGRTTAFGSGD